MSSAADTTVDPREVEFYTRLANSWWDRMGPFWPLHKLNELRSDYIRRRAADHFGRDPRSEQPLEGLTVLDVGCGGGILAESMAGMGATVRGIDVVEKNVRVAELHAKESGLSIDYRVQAVAAEVGRGNRYDIVLNMEVVEHVADVSAFMRDCCATVARDGMMFVATINRTPKAWLFAIVGAEYVLGWLPKGTHQWRNFMTPAEIGSHLESGGLRVDGMTGVAANPISRRLSLARSTAVNYMLHASARAPS